MNNVYWGVHGAISKMVDASILMIGDSWLWYPMDNLTTEIGGALPDQMLVAIGYGGAEAREWSEKYRKDIDFGFKMYGASVKALMLSGGGNDIAGMRDFLRLLKEDCSQADTPADCFREGQPEAIITKIIGTALRDLVFIVILPNTGILPAYTNVYGETSWVRYVWVAFGITMAWVIAERMRKSTQAIARMNRTLSQRLAARELELDAVFALQARSERQQAMLEERQRLTRDMHDGLGSQLVGALQLAQNPAVSKEMLAVQLRETLDHLKMTVDAMQDTQGDIASLLGALRYRLNPRFAAAGVQLTWSVDPLPEIAGWTLQKSRDVQMILFETFSNLITHAGATHAALHAAHHAQQGHIRIVLQDNGRGFDVDAMAAAGGHGLANMRARAARIGADLHIESAPEGTKTTLILPLDGAHS